MGDENPIRTLGDYSKPSHEGYRNTIELPVGNNVVPLRSNTSGSITTWEDLTTRFLARFFPQGRTAKLRNDILMFQQHQGESLLKAWTRFKDLLQKEEEEKNDKDDVATGDGIKNPDEPNTKVPVKEAETKNGAENRTKNKPIKKAEKEEAVEAPSSQPVEYYLKHKTNEKLIEGLVDNNIFNDSLLGVRVGKIKEKTYNLSPRGPIYEAVLKKKITKKEDIGGNFEIPCNIGGLKLMNAIVDQGSNVNVMPLSTYMKLTDKRPVKTDI
ncbi:MAK10-like protein [Tanacetum coccineum]